MKCLQCLTQQSAIHTALLTEVISLTTAEGADEVTAQCHSIAQKYRGLNGRLQDFESNAGDRIKFCSQCAIAHVRQLMSMIPALKGIAKSSVGYKAELVQELITDSQAIIDSTLSVWLAKYEAVNQ